VDLQALHSISRSGGSAIKNSIPWPEDQKKYRDELLNRFMQSQASDPHDESDRRNQLDNETDSENSEDDDDASKGAEDGIEPLQFEQLQAVIAFLYSGPSYEDLKSNIYSLAHPPKSIPEAIRKGGVRRLSKLLKKQLNKVTIGEYSNMP
jgi:hypothetical protein